MAISRKMEAFIERSSWIRKMFEEGSRLKAIHGAENVSDFSLGNPNVPPPPVVNETLKKLVSGNTSSIHAYMPNSGYEDTRAAVASYLTGVLKAKLSSKDIVMTCGAAGGLNIILKALLDEGDEVISPAPYFVEYNFYCDNHGGSLVTVPTNDDFSLNIDEIEKAVSPRTKAVLINSPNNPTGQVYAMEELSALAQILEDKSRKIGHRIYLVSDEPYRDIVYDGTEVPSLFEFYRHSIVTSSYSKNLSIPGERIGYVVVHPEAEKSDTLLGALNLANRILGFVNAPALMQRLITHVQGICVDKNIYKTKRDLLCKILKEAGFEFKVPRGAFYVFPKSPIPDDVQFVKILQEEMILAVPGSGFGGPGYFRLAYCVDDHTIERSYDGFKSAFERATRKGA